jgi:uncharacterized protein (DUF58 family)
VAEATFPLVARGRIVGLAFGAMPSSRRGTGSDTAGSREYVPGDSVADIDWAASARLSSARGGDEFVVREDYAEEAPRVVIVADRRPEMQLVPAGLPWLRKAEAQRSAIELISASAVAAHGFVGYLDFAEGGERPFWLPPQAQSLWALEERDEQGVAFDAAADNITAALDFLLAHPRLVPAGTFVFILSDFLVPPPLGMWSRAVEQRWDVVPVVLQDPVWERSFPPVHSFVLPVGDAHGEVHEVWLRRRDAENLRRENEERWERLLAEFTYADVEPVLVSSAGEEQVLRVFLDWAEERQASVEAGMR